VDTIIDLAPGAEENPLAVDFADRIRKNLAEKPKKKQDFKWLRGSVLVVAQDTGLALTMRFDHGRLTIHDGTVGVPSVTLCGDEEVRRSLPNIGVSKLLGLPAVIPLTSSGRTTLWDVGQAVVGERLRIYGLMAHPRFFLCLLRVVSAHG
jgi:hypothetical protein